MPSPRVMLATYVDLDPTPGAFHTADSARSIVNATLQRVMPHYTPIVSVVSYGRQFHTVIFDHHNTNYNGSSPEYNMLFVKGVLNYLNSRLAARGYLFLNEAYEALGLPLTREGQIVGWTDDQVSWDPKYNDNGTIEICFYVEGCIIDKAFENQDEI